MAKRHKRRDSLYESDREQFVEKASRFHREILSHQTNLRPTQEDYKLLESLNEKVRETIKAISRGELPWVRDSWRRKG